jgi:uncharacterized membrane protein/protein-disulfide isomerase
VTPRTRNLLGSFALLGLAASAAATWVHYHLISNPDYTSFCDVTSTISCKQAYLSAYGSIGGVPVALGGLLFFTLAVLLAWGAGRSARLQQTAASYLFVLSAVGLAVVLYLAYASFFVLREVCPLCVLTYIAVIGLFAVSAREGRKTLSTLPGRIVGDLGALVSSSLATAVAVVFILGASFAIAYFPRQEERPVVQLQTLSPNQRAELERWFEVQPKVEMPFPKETARVVVVKFNDYQCPPCRATYFAYEPVLAKYKDRPGDVKFLLKQFPLNQKCNPSISGTAHAAACEAAAGAIMARSTGAFDKLSDWFYLHQDKLTPSVVRDAAARVAQITDFDARYSAAIEEVKAEAAAGAKLGVNSTPTFFVNGRKVPAMPPEAMDALIDYELKRGS